MWNRKRKNIVVILLAVMIMLVFSVEVFAEKEQGTISSMTGDNYNVMLLIDKSGSMNKTDRDGIVLSAACQFMDQLCTNFSGMASTTKVGVMAFDQSTHLLCELKNLNSKDNTDSLKAEINGISYNQSGVGGTDLGIAVYDAARFLNGRTQENEKNVIVMFTDGYSEKVLNQDKSDKCLERAYKIAEKLKSSIYIVGLNCNGTITQNGQEEIYKIADTAQAGEGIEKAEDNDRYAKKGRKVNYLITDSIDRVRDFYGKIYAKMFGGKVEFINDHRFQINQDGVVSAEVTVYSDTKIEGISLTDPDGSRRENDNRSVDISGDNRYKVIKIKEPDVGKWKVKVKTKDKGYQMYLIRLYGVGISAGSTWSQNGDEGFENTGLTDPYIGRIRLTPVFDGEAYRNDSFMKSITTAECTVTDPVGTKTYALEYEEKSGDYVGFFPVQNGTYEIEATLANKNFKRQVSDTLNVNGAGPGLSMDLKWGVRDTEGFTDTGLYGVYLGRVDVTFENIDLETVDSFAESVSTAEYLLQYNGQTETYPLEYYKDSGSFTGYFPVQKGDYKIEANLQNDTWSGWVTGSLTADINYDEISLGISSSWGKKGEEGFSQTDVEGKYIGRVEVTPQFGEEDYRDFLFMESISDAEYIVTGEGLSETYPLEYDEEMGNFIGFFSVTNGTFLVQAVLSGDGWSKEAESSLEVRAFGLYKWGRFIFCTMISLVFIFIAGFLLHRRWYVTGAFHILIEKTDEETGKLESMSNDVYQYPRGRKFSLWKLIEVMIDSRRAQDQIPEKDANICKVLEAERVRIARNKLVIITEKNSQGSHKIYQFDNGSNLLYLAHPRSCYGSVETDLKITLSFTPYGK